MIKKITVRGQQLRTTSPQRYLAISVRATTVITPAGSFIPFAHLLKRSDSFDVAQAAARRYRQACIDGAGAVGATAVVIDTTTGAEV